MNRRVDLVAGVRAVAPILLGVVPFALVAGVTAVGTGFSVAQAVGMSVILFAGASQLAAIELLGETAPVAVVVLTAIVINLRFVMYSASLAPHLRQYDWLTKAVGAYLLTDQAYALSVAEYRDTSPDERSRKWFYLAAAATLWATWQVGTLVGAVVGAGVPQGLSLEFAVPLTFMALLVPALDDRPTFFAATVGGGLAVLAAPLPFNLGLIVAGVVGIAAGVRLEQRRGTFPTLEGEGATDGDAGGED